MDGWHEFRGWGKARHMEADFYDLYVKAHTAKGKKPGVYPRPSKAPQPQQGIPLMQMFPRRKG